MNALDTNVLARFFIDDPDDAEALQQRPGAVFWLFWLPRSSVGASRDAPASCVPLPAPPPQPE